MPKEAEDQVYLQMTQSVPMKRMGQPEEIAKAVAFLAIDATYTTGKICIRDSGKRTWYRLRRV